jgi:putative CRISPR-associated protein (TIGR02619 family)
MHVIVSAVGTSLISNYNNSIPQNNNIFSKLEIRNAHKLSPEDKYQNTIMKNFLDIKNELLRFIEKSVSPTTTSAEINAIEKLVSKLNLEGEKNIILYYTNTQNAKVCAEALKEYFEDNYTVELINVRVIQNQQDFDEGITDLFDKVQYRIIVELKKGNSVYVNATPGFKAESAYITLASLLVGARVFYIHESFNDIIELPSIPIQIREDVTQSVIKLFSNQFVVPIISAKNIVGDQNLKILINSGIVKVKNDSAIEISKSMKKLIEYARESRNQS